MEKSIEFEGRNDFERTPVKFKNRTMATEKNVGNHEKLINYTTRLEPIKNQQKTQKMGNVLGSPIKPTNFKLNKFDDMNVTQRYPLAKNTGYAGKVLVNSRMKKNFKDIRAKLA